MLRFIVHVWMLWMLYAGNVYNMYTAITADSYLEIVVVSFRQFHHKFVVSTMQSLACLSDCHLSC